MAVEIFIDPRHFSLCKQDDRTTLDRGGSPAGVGGTYCVPMYEAFFHQGDAAVDIATLGDFPDDDRKHLRQLTRIYGSLGNIGPENGIIGIQPKQCVCVTCFDTVKKPAGDFLDWDCVLLGNWHSFGLSIMSNKFTKVSGCLHPKKMDVSFLEGLADMTNVLIVFYSRNGSTETLANAVSQGAQAAGGVVRTRRCRELVDDAVMRAVPGWKDSAVRMNAAYDAPTPEDALWADAIVFGSPTRFGLVCSEVKAYMDGLGALWAQGALAGKAGSAFTSTSSLHGGNEVTSLTLYVPMMHFGMVLVPPGYTDAAMFQAGTPYGASSVSAGPMNLAPTEADLNAARHQGMRVTEIAGRLKASG